MYPSSRAGQREFEQARSAAASQPPWIYTLLWSNRLVARFRPDREIDGRNILPMLNGESESPHNELFYYFRSRIFAVRLEHWKLHMFKRELGPKGKPKAAVRCEELYDLNADPGEKNNVASDHPDVVRLLTQRAMMFHAGIEPVMKLPPPSSSVVSGLVTQAPKKSVKVPR